MASSDSIKELRKKLQMTQVELAQELGCSQNTISQYEHGVKTPSVKIAQKMVRLAKENKIKVTLTDIFPED